MRIFAPLPVVRPPTCQCTRLYSTSTNKSPLVEKGRKDNKSPALVDKKKKYLQIKAKQNKAIARRRQNSLLRTPAPPKSRLEMVQRAVIKGDAKAVYEIAERLKPSITKFDQLLSVCGKTGKVKQIAEGMGESDKLFERANWILNEMEKFNVKMNIATLNVFLKVCVKHGQADKAIELCEKMEEQEIEPDLVTYSLWITAYKNKLDMEHPELVQHEKIHEIENSDIVTNKTRNQLKPIFDLYEQMKEKNILPHVQFFNTWLQICKSSSGPSIVFEVFAEMKKARVQADFRTYDILLNVCTNTNRIQYGMDLFKTISHGNLPMDTQLANSFLRLPHVVFFNSRSTTEQDKRMAIEFTDRVLSLMKERRLPYNLDTYQILIALYGRQDNPEKVNETFSKLETQGLKPNIKTYTSLLSAFRVTKQVEAAHTLYHSLQDKHFRMDNVFLRNLLKLFRENDKMDYAAEVVRGMRAQEEREMAPKLVQSQGMWDEESRLRAEGRVLAAEKEEKRKLKLMGREYAKMRVERKAERDVQREEEMERKAETKKEEETKEETKEEGKHKVERVKEPEMAEREEKGKLKQSTNKEGEKKPKYVNIYSDDEDEAFIPEVSESLFKLALERHKQDALTRKPKLANEEEQSAPKKKGSENENEKTKEKTNEKTNKKEEEGDGVENVKSPLLQLRKKQTSLK